MIINIYRPESTSKKYLSLHDHGTNPKIVVGEYNSSHSNFGPMPNKDQNDKLFLITATNFEHLEKYLNR